jgi:hypothetical protein
VHRSIITPADLAISLLKVHVSILFISTPPFSIIIIIIIKRRRRRRTTNSPIYTSRRIIPPPHSNNMNTTDPTLHPAAHVTNIAVLARLAASSNVVDAPNGVADLGRR